MPFPVQSSQGQFPPSYYGYGAYTGDPGQAGLAGSPVTSGAIWAYRLPVTNSFSATKIDLFLGVAAVGGTATQNLLGLYNETPSGTSFQIGTCPDQAAAWNGATGPLSAALTVVGGQSLAIGANTYIWVLQLQVFVTSGASFKGFNQNTLVPNMFLGAPAFRVARQNLAQTVLPVSFTPASLTSTNNVSPGLPFVAVG